MSTADPIADRLAAMYDFLAFSSVLLIICCVMIGFLPTIFLFILMLAGSIVARWIHAWSKQSLAACGSLLIANMLVTHV
jgi:hypothetical protein